MKRSYHYIFWGLFILSCSKEGDDSEGRAPLSTSPVSEETHAGEGSLSLVSPLPAKSVGTTMGPSTPSLALGLDSPPPVSADDTTIGPATPGSAGGRPVDMGEYSFMAALVQVPLPTNPNLQANVFCSAFLVAKRFAITAGHCVKGRRTSDIRLLAGTVTKIPAKGEILTVDRISFMSKFKVLNAQLKIHDYDIALLRLSRDLPASTSLKPISLAKIAASSSDTSGVNQFILGWGKTSSNVGTASLLAADLQSVARPLCRSQISGGTTLVTDRMRCAVDRYADACEGDSGGPLIVYSTNEVVGVTSWGTGQCEGGSTGVYADLTQSEIRSWLRSNTGI